jgi:hypothetical protein
MPRPAQDRTQGPKDQDVTNQAAPNAVIGRQFLNWLVDGLAKHTLDYNNPGTRVHVVEDGVLLVSPALFLDYVEWESPSLPWEKIQKAFLKLGLHARAQNGMNIHRYAVKGDHRNTAIFGLLIKDASTIFGDRTPRPNPHLARS